MFFQEFLFYFVMSLKTKEINQTSPKVPLEVDIRTPITPSTDCRKILKCKTCHQSNWAQCDCLVPPESEWHKLPRKKPDYSC
jgi:hypothetical protein